MSEALLLCHCPHILPEAKATFHLTYPHASLPSIYRGESEIVAFAESLPEQSSIKLKALTLAGATHTRFAYYLRWREDGAILEAFNLLSKRKVQ